MSIIRFDTGRTLPKIGKSNGTPSVVDGPAEAIADRCGRRLVAFGKGKDPAAGRRALDESGARSRRLVIPPDSGVRSRLKAVLAPLDFGHAEVRAVIAARFGRLRFIIEAGAARHSVARALLIVSFVSAKHYTGLDARDLINGHSLPLWPSAGARCER